VKLGARKVCRHHISSIGLFVAGVLALMGSRTVRPYRTRGLAAHATAFG
jgi:hypothetical protein